METIIWGAGQVLEPLDPWYVTGFAEGEGTFTYSRVDRNISIYFAIKLHESDVEILRRIQAFFGGAGGIYHVRARVPTKSAGYSKAAKYYRVTRLAELDRIVDHFDAFPLQGHKTASYRIWREIFVLKRDSFRKPDRDHLNELASALSAVAIRNQPWRAGEP